MSVQAKGPKRAPDAWLAEFLLNHLAMSPQLPQQQDPYVPLVESALLERLLSAAKSMRDLPKNPNYAIWDSVARSLEVSVRLSICIRPETAALMPELRDVVKMDFLVLHVHGQNAGIFIYPAAGENAVIFEMFEASPKSESVLAASNALVCDFPGAAIPVPLENFLKPLFLDSLSSFLETASQTKPTDEFAAFNLKAGSQTTEVRETSDPSIICSMLAVILEANGQRIAPDILCKRVRDDVCWKSNLPWRRLHLWLVLRVTIRRF